MPKVIVQPIDKDGNPRKKPSLEELFEKTIKQYYRAPSQPHITEEQKRSNFIQALMDDKPGLATELFKRTTESVWGIDSLAIERFIKTGELPPYFQKLWDGALHQLSLRKSKKKR